MQQQVSMKEQVRAKTVPGCTFTTPHLQQLLYNTTCATDATLFTAA
jgi:hypothetical protein